MKKSLRFPALLLAVLMMLSSFATVSSAAEAEAVEIDGVMTAFVSNFGKMSYAGSSRVAFKNLDDALSALPGGGKIVFTGTSSVSSDTLGKGGPLTVEGIGSRVTGNVIVSESPMIIAENDLTFSNVSFKFPENSGFVMNGHDFTSVGEIDTYYTVTYPSNEKSYHNLISLYSGDAKEDYTFTLTSGSYDTVAIASGNVEADSKAVITGGSYNKLVIGSLDGVTNGDIDVVIENADIAELIIGAQNGKMNGKIDIAVDGETTIGSIKAGAYGEGSSFSGSATVTVTSGKIGEIASSGEGKTDASVVYVCNTASDIEIADDAKYNSILSIKGGFIVPVYENEILCGIHVYDKFGCAAAKVASASGDLTAKDGVYLLPEGKFEGEVVSGLNLGINDSANYVAGYEDGSFKPQNNMTRAEAVTLLTRIIANEEVVKGGLFDNNFADVDENAWYAKYIGFFDKTGLLAKVSDGENAAPTQPITRGEFVQLIYNIETLLDEDGVTYAEFSKLVHNVSANIENAKKFDEFSDVDYTNKHGNAIYHAVTNGYVNGYTDGTFAPDGNITRAEVVTVVNRMLGRKPMGDAGASFSDVSGHWAASQIVAASGAYGSQWTRSSELGTAADGTSISEYVKTLVTAKNPSDLENAISNHVYKSGSEALASKDITPEQKASLKEAITSVKDEARNKNIRVMNGSPDDPTTYMYAMALGPVVRDVVIESKKPDTEPVNIVSTSDTHFNLVNELDEEEKNPSVMSTKIYRTWLANGVSVTPVKKVMDYAKYADQMVVCGDILDYLSHGCKQLTIENLFRVDTDILACLGNHDTTRVMQGKVSDPTSYDSRLDFIKEFWIHDVRYESKVLKDKVMCVVVDNGSSKFWDEQVEKLKADIEKARENDYIILVFFHIPISTRNPEDSAVYPITGNTADPENFADMLGKTGTTGATGEFYELLTTNGDIVRGVFNGHVHNDYYTEILATYIDGNGNVVNTTIPQYTGTATVYDNTGHIFNITVK